MNWPASSLYQPTCILPVSTHLHSPCINPPASSLYQPTCILPVSTCLHPPCINLPASSLYQPTCILPVSTHLHPPCINPPASSLYQPTCQTQKQQPAPAVTINVLSCTNWTTFCFLWKPPSGWKSVSMVHRSSISNMITLAALSCSVNLAKLPLRFCTPVTSAKKSFTNLLLPKHIRTSYAGKTAADA